MLFRTEEEKEKFKEEQEKKAKSYEKIEKKIFSNPKIIIDEIDKKNTEDLRHVLFVNKEDFCFEYFKTLPENQEGENEFIKIFNFTFSDENELYLKSKLMVIDDMKKYIEIATDKRFARAIDTVVSFFENKIEIMAHLKLTILTSIINGNNTFLDFLFTRTGDNEKISKLTISDEMLWEDSKCLKNIINYGGIFDDEYHKILLGQYKHIAFLKERNVDKIISKMKVLIQSSKEVKSFKDEEALIKKIESVQNIFFLMNENTLNELMNKFIEKKELDVLFKYGFIIDKCLMKLYKLNQTRDIDYSDVFHYEKQKHEQIIYSIHKNLLELSDNEKKIEVVNNGFVNAKEKYSKEEKEIIENLTRRQDLLITLNQEKKPLVQQRKKI